MKTAVGTTTALLKTGRIQVDRASCQAVRARELTSGLSMVGCGLVNGLRISVWRAADELGFGARHSTRCGRRGMTDDCLTGSPILTTRAPLAA